MNRRQTFLLTGGAMVVLVAGIGLGWWWAGQGSAPMTNISATAMTEGEREVLYWYDPMVPDQHFDKPGKSPFMDMQLVPKYADEASGTGNMKGQAHPAHRTHHATAARAARPCPGAAASAGRARSR